MRRSILIAAATGAAIVATFALALAVWSAIVPGQPVAASSLAPGTLLQASPLFQNGSVPQSGIIVAGEGSVTVKPDTARVTLGVEVTDATADGAQQEAARKMDSVMAELKKLGIEEKDIQTVQFQLSPDYDYSSREPVLKGYRATNLVAVTVRDLSKVGGLLDAVVASGATRLQGIGFMVSDPAAAGALGREEAMKSAKAKAEQLARLAGVTLGQPVAIEETSSAPPVPVEMDVARAAPAAAPTTPISPGTQEIRTMVRVTYAIK